MQAALWQALHDGVTARERGERADRLQCAREHGELGAVFFQPLAQRAFEPQRQRFAPRTQLLQAVTWCLMLQARV